MTEFKSLNVGMGRPTCPVCHNELAGGWLVALQPSSLPNLPPAAVHIDCAAQRARLAMLVYVAERKTYHALDHKGAYPECVIYFQGGPAPLPVAVLPVPDSWTDPSC